MYIRFLTIISLFTLLSFSCYCVEREKYGDVSSAYARGREGFYPETVMKTMEKFLKPSDRILDVASGTGIGTRYLCEHGYKNIVGEDYDAKMIEQAEQLNTEKCKIQYIVGDIKNELPFPANSFDVITTFNAFHQYADASSIKEISRLLKRKGTFIIVTKNLINDPIKRAVQKIISDYSGINHLSSSLNTATFLEENGFIVIDQIPIAFELSYDRNKYLDYALFASARWNTLQNTPQGEEILKKVNQYLDTVADAQGQIKEKREILVIAAKKRNNFR